MVLNNSSLLVTGGTGTFGRHFIETVLEKYNPTRIVVFSRDEQKHFDMQHSFRDPRMRFFIGDVRDYERLKMAMKGIDYVVHAAAMKHVPLAEYNPFECLKTNVHGAEHIVRAAMENNVKKVIALSTDKAASPINLYGASKLASDKLFVSANNMSGKNGTRFSVVRYGNVVASKGSVVPFFERLITEGATEMPITDERMTRFWMTLQQSIDFVTSNFERMKGGEIFVPKIPSIKITDLATAMAPDLKQKVIGIRPGEKLHEVMCPHEDAHLTLEFDDHFIIKPSITYWDEDVDFSTNKLGETGRAVPIDFNHHSGNNAYFLTHEEIIEYNELAHSHESFIPYGNKGSKIGEKI